LAELTLTTLQILQEEVKNCGKCDLHKTRTNTVFARGNPAAALCFLGEGPGQEEDQQGLPFVGKSGQLLDQTLTQLGLDVEKDIYVCNAIKCRPPGNRKPTEAEIDTCFDFLDQQLKLVNPKVVVALGNSAVSALLPIEMGITKIRGKFFKRGKMWVMPAYHPSFILRNGSGGQVYQDFKDDLRLAIDRAKEPS
jgi:uracil-DNA glycosylase